MEDDDIEYIAKTPRRPPGRKLPGSCGANRRSNEFEKVSRVSKQVNLNETIRSKVKKAGLSSCPQAPIKKSQKTPKRGLRIKGIALNFDSDSDNDSDCDSNYNDNDNDSCIEDTESRSVEGTFDEFQPKMDDVQPRIRVDINTRRFYRSKEAWSDGGPVQNLPQGNKGFEKPKKEKMPLIYGNGVTINSPDPCSKFNERSTKVVPENLYVGLDFEESIVCLNNVEIEPSFSLEHDEVLPKKLSMPLIYGHGVTVDSPDPCSKFNADNEPSCTDRVYKELNFEDDIIRDDEINMSIQASKVATPMPLIYGHGVTVDSPDPCSKFNADNEPSCTDRVYKELNFEDDIIRDDEINIRTQASKVATPMPLIYGHGVTVDSPDPCSKHNNRNGVESNYQIPRYTPLVNDNADGVVNEVNFSPPVVDNGEDGIVGSSGDRLTDHENVNIHVNLFISPLSKKTKSRVGNLEETPTSNEEMPLIYGKNVYVDSPDPCSSYYCKSNDRRNQPPEKSKIQITSLNSIEESPIATSDSPCISSGDGRSISSALQGNSAKEVIADARIQVSMSYSQDIDAIVSLRQYQSNLKTRPGSIATMSNDTMNKGGSYDHSMSKSMAMIFGYDLPDKGVAEPDGLSNSFEIYDQFSPASIALSTATIQDVSNVGQKLKPVPPPTRSRSLQTNVSTMETQKSNATLGNTPITLKTGSSFRRSRTLNSSNSQELTLDSSHSIGDTYSHMDSISKPSSQELTPISERMVNDDSSTPEVTSLSREDGDQNGQFVQPVPPTKPSTTTLGNPKGTFQRRNMVAAVR